MYYCMNLSASGDGQAVLLRAVEPLEGMDTMQTLRAKSRKAKSDKLFADKMLANGPSKMCMAFDINKDNINKVDITDSDLIWIERADTVPEENIVSTGRVGIPRAQEWANKPLRFYIKNNLFISQK
ncbi:unnamed protein product [Medioppia subpectinata]|nr:unnamed protein product [Medioppia subpectinata]CAG2103103.1 unnamed protein product [Medioppia subpectinata]